MRTIARGLIILCLPLAFLWNDASVVSAGRVRAQNTLMTINVSSATKVFDLGGTGLQGSNGIQAASPAPSGWMSATFDDSAWQGATPVPPPIQTCITARNSNVSGQWTTAPAYWGTNEADDYLVRQVFTLPSAQDYTGSTLVAGIFNYTYGSGSNPPAQIYLNGRLIDQQAHENYASYKIAQFLVPGTNILAMYAPSSHDAGVSSNLFCGAFTFTATIHVNAPAPPVSHPPLHRPSTVSGLMPAQNAIVAGTTMPFSWQRFDRARFYYLQVWLTQLARGQTISAPSVTAFSTRVTATHYNLNAQLMPKGVYQWRVIAVDAHGNTISAWTPDHSLTLQ